MADFRRYLYALALVALLAGLTVSASAQTMNCTQSTGVPPVVRAEGYSELMGDLVLDCTGGIPTAPGQSVPAVNILVNLDTFVSSQTTAVVTTTGGAPVEFLESLLIIDEPNSPSNSTTPILNCGRTLAPAAPDNLQAGAGVCQILGGGSLGAGTTYNGTAGHPNVFQGRSFRLITGQTNQVVFAGIPIDPPGTICAIPVNNQCHRIVRITNIRGDASTKGVAQGNQTSTITADLIINPASGLPVDIPTHVVARVQVGLITAPLLPVTPKLDFIQCSSLQPQNPNGIVFNFREGFENAFKPQSLTQILLNGTAKPSYNYVNGLTPVITQGVLNNQNVPGSVYDTESGFTDELAASFGDNPLNPLTGTPGTGIAFSDTNSGLTAPGTHISVSGKATQGTRLMINFSNMPGGTFVTVPNVVQLTNVIGGGATGVAVLVLGTTSSGFGGTPTAAAGSSTVAGVQGGITAPNRAVYEVFFSNPNALEQLSVPMVVNGTPNLPSNLPAPNIVSQVQGNFAPFYDPATNIRTTAIAAGSENTVATPATLAIPRFQRLGTPTNFFAISRCSCNLLFPFVTNAPTAGGNFDTGMAIANTSLDPGNLAPTVYGFNASAQAGPVQLWYYNRNATPAAEPNFLSQGNTQCTNVTTPGSCTGTLTNVPAGGMLTMTLSSGGVINGATPAGAVLLPASGFTGYMIAQTGFQYCHGFAFISKQGAGFQADNLAMGYLAIVLNPPGLYRISSSGENIAH